jgi:hypothetical protein
LRKPARALVVVMALLALGACSDDGDDEPADGAEPSVLERVPSSDGDECEDPVGDLSASATAEAGVGSDPPGIDLVKASALAEGDVLEVRFETAGPIEEAPDPSFVVAQGAAGDELGFEIRAVRGEGGNWALTLIRWGPQGEARTSIADPVDVDGNVLSYAVPLSALPPLALYIAFGSTARVPGVGTVLDECSPFDESPTTTTTTG